jgi:hypothetical protein
MSKEMSIKLNKKQIFKIGSALRILIADVTAHYDEQPTKTKLKQIEKLEKLLKYLGEYNGKF